MQVAYAKNGRFYLSGRARHGMMHRPPDRAAISLTARPNRATVVFAPSRDGHMTIAIARRKLLAALGGLAAWPLAARAQQPAKLPRVGILSPAASETAATLTAFGVG